MNKVILIGRLTAEPDIRETQSGTTVAQYRLAVDRQFKREGQADADFLPCVAWGRNADFADKYLHKGMRIAVEGQIQTRNYDDKDGRKIYVTEIIVDRQEFCESKGSAAVATVNNTAAAQPAAAQDDGFVDIGADDDWPF